MPRMYLSHVAYCTTLRCSNSHHQSSPQEILAVRGRAEPYLFLDVPTFTTSRLPRDPSSQRWNYVDEKWPMNFAWNARLPHSIQGSFTCRKSTTWDRRLYGPSEGRRAEDFLALKNPTASAGFEPANLGTKGQHATSRPPKPLNEDINNDSRLNLITEMGLGHVMSENKCSSFSAVNVFN
jgi:hypothetical protein